MATVHIVNPKPRNKKGAKSMATPPRDPKTGKFRKRKGSRKRKSNPGKAVARRSSSSPRRRSGGRRRRSNPSNGGSSITLRSVWPSILPAVAGRLWLAFAVRRWGGTWGTSVFGTPGVPPSPYAGQQWSFQGYLVGLLAMWAGAKMIARWKGNTFAFHFWRGGIENMATRLIWTEGIARSTWGQTTFGNTTVMDDRTGTRWLQTPTGYQSMMGLTPARPLDGLQPARPLDDYLVRERPIDVPARGVGGRRMQVLGHYLPADVDDTNARYHGSGSNSPYHSAFQRSY